MVLYFPLLHAMPNYCMPIDVESDVEVVMLQLLDGSARIKLELTVLPSILLSASVGSKVANCP